jgi:uncharacterized glyoxalase superfamily protein PhnB
MSYTVTPHLIVSNSVEAIAFYTSAFGAEETRRVLGPDGESIVYAEMKIGNSTIAVSDEFPGCGPCTSPNTLHGTSVCIHLHVEDAEQAMNRALTAGARVSMSISDMAWGGRYGKVTDPFGHEWSLVMRDPGP